MSSFPNVVLVLVGGIHPSSYTLELLLTAAADPILGQIPLLMFPAQPAATVLSGHSLRTWLDSRLLSLDPTYPQQPPPDLIIWAFSAGCVGAVGLAHHWQQHRGQILALFALDGWGVPLATAYPTYRLSHDYFTHVTSRWLGAGPINFYAEPPVPHLDLWQHSRQTEGWQTLSSPGTSQASSQRQSAAEFLCHWSRLHLQRETLPFFNGS